MVNEDLLEQHIRLTFKEFSSLEKLYDIFVHKYLTLCFRQSWEFMNRDPLLYEIR